MSRIAKAQKASTLMNLRAFFASAVLLAVPVQVGFAQERPEWIDGRNTKRFLTNYLNMEKQ